MIIDDLEKILPHRPPMLLVDKVLELEPGKRVVAVKNTTINDHFFQGHFPDRPIMPGVLIVEALAQAAILLYQKPQQNASKNASRYYLGSVKANFRKPVVPGDQLILEANAVRITPTGSYVEAKAFVNKEIVAEADLILMIEQ